MKTALFATFAILACSSLPTLASDRNAKGHFELYCDGVGLFLARIDGAPAPGKLVMFSYLGFPGGTFGGEYIGQGRWSNVDVYSDGCVPGYCKSIADGRVWIDALDTPPKHVSGKYEITLNSKVLKGTFLAKKKATKKRPIRLCM